MIHAGDIAWKITDGMISDTAYEFIHNIQLTSLC